MSGSTTPAESSLRSTQSIVAFGGMGIVVLVLGIVAWRGNDQLLETTASFLLGQAFGSIISYFFGSAVGSHSKDATIASLAQKGPPP